MFNILVLYNTLGINCISSIIIIKFVELLNKIERSMKILSLTGKMDYIGLIALLVHLYSNISLENQVVLFKNTEKYYRWLNYKK